MTTTSKLAALTRTLVRRAVKLHANSLGRVMQAAEAALDTARADHEVARADAVVARAAELYTASEVDRCRVSLRTITHAVAQELASLPKV